jgi:Rod binding domain-containing protein
MDVASLNRHVSARDVSPERLARNSSLSEREKIGEASRQFESILLRQILDASQKTVIKSKYSDNSTAGSIYRDLITNQLADSISKSGAFGLAKVFEKQLVRPDDSDETAESQGESGLGATAHGTPPTIQNAQQIHTISTRPTLASTHSATTNE